jgi:hypothetical protein
MTDADINTALGDPTVIKVFDFVYALSKERSSKYDPQLEPDGQSGNLTSQ